MFKTISFLLLLTVSTFYLWEGIEAMQKNGIQCGCRYPRIYRPVCGEDNVTYDNAGVIRCVNKCNHTDLKVLHEGVCTGDDQL